MTPAISVAGLSRRYRGQLALDDITFDLEPGSITGLLGRNGAGKTTLLRIVALPTHLIDEAAGLLERVVVIDRGRIVLDAAADDLRGAATSVSGPAIAVAEFTAGRPVWDRRRIASRESAVVAGALDETDRARAAALHLHLEPLTLQQLVVRAAGTPAASPQERTSA
jgi:ABC-2 type transport system ATP-binding protein